MALSLTKLKQLSITFAKVAGLFLGVLALVLLFAHYGIQMGLNTEQVHDFMGRTWWLWVLIRLSIYAGCGYGIYRIMALDKEKTEENMKAYKSLIRTAILIMIGYEFVVFSWR